MGATMASFDEIAAAAITGKALPEDPPARTEPLVAREAPVGVDGLHLTELGNAERLVASHGDEIRYVAAWGQWLRWDGTRWATDHDAVAVGDLAADVARKLWRDVAAAPSTSTRDASAKWAKRSEASSVITAAIRLARAMPGVRIDHDRLDADASLLNVANGTVQLADPQVREHRPDDLLTKVAGASWDKDAAAPAWDKFLADVLPDPELRLFVQRSIGYCLTGSVSEQVLFLLVGDGANGKSTFVSAIEHVLGDYAGIAAKELLVAQRHEGHPTSVADLFGVRFAVGVETEQSNVLAEAKVKQLTGGDKLKARRMREDFWSFEPTHKLWIATNHLPRIRGRDHAIWRRIRVVPFEVTIAEADRDPDLLGKLRGEASGILRWAVEGYVAWREQGLDAPQSVVDAVAQYRADQDWVARFCDAKELEIRPGGQMFTTELNEMYRSWCHDEGEPQLASKAFATELQERGCERSNSSGKRIWKGIWKCS